ncbi:MAG: S8 family serine peptidase [Acidimicrobiales bacterium]|nr:S8 family serine peptidase [Acidimicrobiales bacterium]
MRWWLGAVALAAAAVLSVAVANRQASGQTLAAPTVASVDSGDEALTVIWAPGTGVDVADVAAFDLRWIASGASDSDKADGSNWTVRSDAWVRGRLVAIVDGLTNGTSYDVAVRARTSALTSAWSAATAATPTEPGATVTTAATIRSGVPLGGVLGSTADVDFFAFTVSAAQAGSEIAIRSSGETDVKLEMTKADGTPRSPPVARNDAGAEPGPRNFIFQGTIADAGTYYFKVTSGGSPWQPTGQYTLHLHLAPDTSGFANATAVTLGSTTEAAFVPYGALRRDRDFFELVLSDAADVTVSVDSPIADALFEVYDHMGNRLAASDDALLTPRLTDPALRISLAAGTYYLRTHARNGGEGPYRVRVQAAAAPGGSLATAAQLGFDTARSGRLAAGGTHYWRFDLAEKTPVVLSGGNVLRQGGAYDGSFIAEVVDSMGESEYVDAYGETYFHHNSPTLTGDRFEAPTTLLPAGTYYLKVSFHNASASGDYLVKLHRDYEHARLLALCPAGQLGVSDPLHGCQWHLDNTGQFGGVAGEDVNVAGAWGTTKGTGVTVGVVDSGLDWRHDDFALNVDKSKNETVYYSPTKLRLLFDLTGHGTRVAGLLAAGDNVVGTVGVAPRATVYGYQLAFGWNVSAYTFALPITHHAAATSIQNHSYSFSASQVPVRTHEVLTRALDTSIAQGDGGKGTVHVFAAGNDAASHFDAAFKAHVNHRGVVVACGVNHQGDRYAHSELGANLWVCAPAAGMRTHAGGPSIMPSTVNYNTYSSYFSGTSASAPLVSGVAALVRSANRALTWRDVKLILAGSARVVQSTDASWSTGAEKYGQAGQSYRWSDKFGFGVVDAGAAVSLAGSWTLLPPETRVSAAQGTPLTVPDITANAVTSTLDVGAGVDFVEHVGVELDLAAPHFRDLDVVLVSPSGAESRLSRPWAGCSRCAVDGWVDLSATGHLGEDAEGTWTLRVADAHRNDEASVVRSWKLTVYGHNTSGVAFDEGYAAPRSVAENAAAGAAVGAPLAATDADGDTLTYSLGGADSASFALDASTGQLSTAEVFDAEAKGSYEVVVTATDGKTVDGTMSDASADASVAVTVTVTDVNEPGTLTLSSAQPQEGVSLTAAVSDPEGIVGAVAWQWHSSSDKTSFALIDGAESAAYTPVAADVGRWLRATATYADRLGSGRVLTAIAADTVTPAPPQLSVKAGTPVTEGSALSFTISASRAPANAVTVDYTVSETGDVVAPADEGAKQATLAANATSVSVQVPTQGDSTDERGGAVHLTIDAGSGYTVSDTAGTAAVGVADDDATVVTLSVPDRLAAEGDSSATATLRLTLNRGMERGETLWVPLGFAGGAVGSDFSLALSGSPAGVSLSAATVTFSGPSTGASAATADVTLTALDDVDASNERVRVSIPASASSGNPRLRHSGLDTINGVQPDNPWLLLDDVDESASAPGVVSVPSDWALIPSGLGTGDRFRLLFITSAKRDAQSADIADYNAFVQGRAAAGHAGIRVYSGGFRAVASSPFVDASANSATSGSDTSRAIWWLGGAKAADGYTDFWDGAWDNEASGDVRDESGAAVTLVSSDRPWTGTASGGAKASAQHLGTVTPTAGTLVANVGNPGGDPGGPVDGGSAARQALSTQLRLYGLSQVLEVAAPATPLVSVTAGTSPVTEGTAASFTLTASPAPTNPITVSYTVAQTGSYVSSANRGTKTVSIGTSGTVTVSAPTEADSIDEPNGSVTVTVSMGAGYAPGSPSSATVTVNDDDLPSLSVSRASAAVTEGSPARFTVSASSAPTGSVTVRYRVSESGSYLAGSAGIRTASLSGRTATVSVPTADDSADESDGSVTVTLLSGSGYTLGSPQVATVTVRDDDTGPVNPGPVNPGPVNPGPGGSVGGGGGGSGGGGAPEEERERSDAVVIVADGWSPADVGVAAVLAAATDGSAVLYTDTARLSASTRDLLDDYLPAEVIVIGGPAAVSDATASALSDAADLDGIERVAGAGRAATAAAVARRALGSPGSAGGPLTVVIANGWSPPDIGIAAAVAARTPRSAVLYVAPGGLSGPAAAVLADYRPTRIVIVGGTAAVTADTEEAIRDAVPAAAIERIAGQSRTATAAAAARSVLGDPARADAVTFVVVNGWSPPDIGVAAALAARTARAAVLYAAPGGLDEPTTALLNSHRVTDVVIIGGTAAVTAPTQQAIAGIAPAAVVERIAGTDRAATAAAAARRTLGNP